VGRAFGLDGDPQDSLNVSGGAVDESGVRTFLRMLALLLALPPLGLGALGIYASVRSGPEGLRELRVQWQRSAPKLGELAKRIEQAGTAALGFEPLARRSVHGAFAGAGLALLLAAFWPARRRARSSSEAEPGEREAPVEIEPSRKERGRLLKSAEQMAEQEGPEVAGGFLLGQGLKDEAVDTFIKGELFDRAAEVRYDQNRFEEAAELYRKAGRVDAAGGIFAQIERFEDAAKCYVASEKHSLAAEMFERAENFAEAGRCYREIGFNRHAAQAFLKGGLEADAADALMASFMEEGGGSTKINDDKARELRGVATKAAELLAKLERFEEAENILVRAGAFGRAAKLAYQTGAYERAAQLFLRVGRGDLAAKALARTGDEEAAARHMGEYLRDKGDDATAVGYLIKAGDFVSAAELCRKLGRFADSGDHYLRASQPAAAAEMFRAASQPERASEAYELAGRFDEAAECLAQSEDVARRAGLLEKAGRAFEAGQLFAQGDRADEAIRVLQQIEASHPRFSEACALLGQLFRDKGMHSLSIKKLEQAAGSDAVRKDNAQIFYELAVALEARGNWARCAEILERILGYDYHYRDAAERLERAKANAAKTPPDTSQSAPSQATQVTTAPGNAGHSLRRYEIVRELGRGGMGVVYLARDSVLEREVAYKVLPEGLRNNPNALKNFLREAKAAAQLNHPSIVTIYDAGESEHGFYLAMELVDGTTLKEVLRHRGAVAPGGVIYILRHMAEALAYAHGKKVVHRDIKTANTMWTTDKQVKIMDFGLAKLMEEVRNATTMISGTPFYMSPEQTLGRNVDHRTDLYSLGVMIFELATGQLPFRKGNVPYHHVHTPPPDPRELKPEVPEALAQLILRCLQKDPAARFQTARALVEEIDRLSGHPG
jgi:tetratricopeptide (TPR) repeat protein